MGAEWFDFVIKKRPNGREQKNRKGRSEFTATFRIYHVNLFD